MSGFNALIRFVKICIGGHAWSSCIAILLMLTLIPFAMRLDETWTDGALTGPVISLVYIFFLMLVTRFLKSLFWAGNSATRARS